MLQDHYAAINIVRLENAFQASTIGQGTRRHCLVNVIDSALKVAGTGRAAYAGYKAEGAYATAAVIMSTAIEVRGNPFE
ncbi:hypothetical protein Tsubulata_050247 [Turnera subulata]|uniref:Uncharacterized protein n=1 Tax=Turnera subulata TaxID=218843 RepID=A0A9Q0J126_9ROSI|nr:hypothetical protein Tsubulata_050247 [Turnera subulata]